MKNLAALRLLLNHIIQPIHGSFELAAAQLTPQALKALDEAAVLLRQTSGFMYVPILAASERAASLAVDAIRPAMAAEPYPVAWPAPRSHQSDATQAAADLEEDLRQLLTNLDEAIAKLPANAVLLLNATSSARSALATRVTTYLNLRREPLRTAQLRFLLLWPAELREALMAGAPDLWSMRSVSPWADEVMLNEPAEVHATANGERVLPGTLSNAMQQRLQSWRSYRNFSEADLSVQDALALIGALYLTRQCVTALDIAERLLEVLRDESINHSFDRQADQAATFSWASTLRSALGDSRGALAAAREAVAIYRPLAAANPVAYEQSLAISLNNLANRLSELGNRQDALAPAKEAVAIRRRLTSTNVAHSPDLAGNLNNLANRLSELGEHQAALLTTQEATDIRRSLALHDPVAHNPGLGESLHTLAELLDRSGDHQRALNVAKEAASIHSHLAQTNPATYDPKLAGSLNNLANAMGSLGDNDGALKAIQEATAIYRHLAKGNPAAYEPYLVKSLNNQAKHLGSVRNFQSALAIAQEATAIYRRLATANPAAYEPGLASCLNNLAVTLSELGNSQDALSKVKEAIAICRHLAQANPAAYESDLAMILGTGMQCYAAAGNRKEATALGTEALALFTRLAQTNPATFAHLREAIEVQLASLQQI